MPAQTLFPIESPVAQRQPKTDRLILEERFLRPAANDKRLEESELRAAHAVLVRWADLESSGRLAQLNETQMQGDFLAQVFGEALGYAGPLDAAFFHLYGIDRDDAEYILSTFNGIHDARTLFPGGVSTAQRILQKYAEFSFAG